MPDVTLVTGAGGFAGSHLLDLLASSGPIVAWHRPGGTPPVDRASGVAWRAVDLLDREAVRRAVEEARPVAVYHCAGAAHVGRAWANSASTLAVNVRGTHHLFEALRAVGTRARVMIPSSALVYASADQPLAESHRLVPNSPYGLSKLAQEMLGTHAAGDGLGMTIARAFNHFGPRQNPQFAASGFARRIADIEAGRWEPEIAVGNLEARRDLTDVRDTVRAYRLIAERGVTARPYNVCSGRAIAIGELLELMLSRARTTVRIRVDPRRYRPNDVPLLVGDPARIEAELGWRPEIPIEQTVTDLLDYWRRQ
jgi:GDP-4-dehydro-6-deoxy-D-mannose reductase